MIQDNVIYQDNQSAFILEKNGKRSSIKRTMHINIRYYFITDRIMKQEASVEFCPTFDMVNLREINLREHCLRDAILRDRILRDT